MYQQGQSRRLLLIRDMTDRVNWGARGASLALREMLEMNWEGVEALPDSCVEGRLKPINTFFPEEIVVSVSVRREENLLYDAFYRFERTMGMRLDYIEEDPKKSARNILQNKNNGE